MQRDRIFEKLLVWTKLRDETIHDLCFYALLSSVEFSYSALLWYAGLCADVSQQILLVVTICATLCTISVKYFYEKSILLLQH